MSSVPLGRDTPVLSLKCPRGRLTALPSELRVDVGDGAARAGAVKLEDPS